VPSRRSHPVDRPTSGNHLDDADERRTAVGRAWFVGRD
jgi:hypothetical protein